MTAIVKCPRYHVPPELFPPVFTMTYSEVLYLALAIKDRFRCRKIAHEPDAKSWAIEQDFLAGVESTLKMQGRGMHPVIAQCQSARKSITTLPAKESIL